MKCEKLDVWKQSARLSSDVYKALRPCKDYGFKDQLTRAGLSIPSNIAEGMEKESVKEQLRFLEIAKGSAAEFATQVYIGMDVGYLDKYEARQWLEKSDHILSMLTNLQKTIKNRNT
jgi:four helix bundle protein